MDRTIVNPWTLPDARGVVQANAPAGVERTVLCEGGVSVAADGNPLQAGDVRSTGRPGARRSRGRPRCRLMSAVPQG